VWSDVHKIRTPLLLRWSFEGENVRGYGLRSPAGRPTSSVVMESDALYTALTGNGVPIEVMIDHNTHGVTSEKYMLEYQSRLLQWYDYFLLGKGDNPIPAMKSSIDYTQELKAAKK
jgi:hypothetical protein